MNKRKQTPIDKLVKKATTRVNRRLKKRPVSKDNIQLVVSTLADMMIIEEGVGVEIISELLKHGRRRRIASTSCYTLEEKKELISQVDKTFSDTKDKEVKCDKCGQPFSGLSYCRCN